MAGLQLNGGLGGDVLIGSRGNDLVTGDDVARLGPGNDTFVWNPNVSRIASRISDSICYEAKTLRGGRIN